MAYAAVISLKQTIHALLNSARGNSREILEFAETAFLLRVLEISRSSSERLNALEGQIRDCAHHLEDVLEFRESVDGELEVEEEEVRQAIASFAEKVKPLKVEYIEELYKQYDATDQYFSADDNIDSDVELIGYSGELFADIRDHMTRIMRPE